MHRSSEGEGLVGRAPSTLSASCDYYRLQASIDFEPQILSAKHSDCLVVGNHYP